MIANIMLFISLYENQSFKKTAELLNMTPSTLSRHISELETELGKQLLIRTSKVFEPTGFGRYLYNQFKHLPEYIDSTINVYKKIDNKSQVSGTINLALGETISYELITPKLNSFLNKYPNLKLNISFLPNIITHSKKNIDIALSPEYIKDDNLENRFVRNEYVQFFCSNSYVVKYGIPLDIEQFKQHKSIGVVRDDVPLDYVKIFNILSKQEVLLDQRLNHIKMNSGVHSYKMGINSDFIFCCPKSLVNHLINTGEVTPVLPNWAIYELAYYIVTKKQVSPEEQLVIDFIYECLKLV